MHLYIKRLLLYVLLPTGLILLLAPMRLYRTEYVERDFVYIEPETVPEEAARERPEPPDPADLSTTNAEQFMTALQNEFRHITEVEARSPTNAAALGIPILNPNDLTLTPALLDAFKTHEMMPIVRMSYSDIDLPTSRRLSDVPIEEWGAFIHEHFEPDTETPRFAFGSKIFTLFVDSGTEDVQAPVPGLRAKTVIAGIIFTLLGLINMQGLYRRRRSGIAIGDRGAVALGDVIVMLVMLFFAYGAVDWGLHRIYATETLSDPEYMYPMALIGYAFIAPFMALYSTGVSAQVVFVDHRGVLLDGLSRKRFIRWPDIEDLRLVDIYSIRKTIGGYYPKHVNQILQIESADQTLRILEPPLTSTKTEILGRLLEHAPEPLKDKLNDLFAKW